MADLQGPRIRIANKKEMKVKKGEIVFLTSGEIKIQPKNKKNNHKVVYLDFLGGTKLIKNDNEILIEDGLIRLKAINKKGNLIECRVTNDGIIKPRKGVNIPGISAKLGALTDQDKEVLDFALAQGVDFIALSFVRNAKEIKNLKNIILRRSKNKKELPQVIAKIERREAVKNFDEILKATDAVMVARGDLGIEMPQENLPILQKEMATKCVRAAKPVIVATQMLDSMIRNPRPTRAEVSDVANAVIDHADAVMLSGETASGKYPIEAVRIMKKIIERTEESPFDDLSHGFLGDQTSSVSAAVAQAAHELLKDSGAKAIVVASMSGFTARMITRHRPDQDIFVMTNNGKTHNQLSLVWGVQSFVLPNCHDLDELIDKSIETLKKSKLVKKGERVVMVAGRPHVKKEHMSLVKVDEIR
jgi:pyruvate kinase